MNDGLGRRKVVLFTRQFEISGNLHLYDGVRQTDYMNESKDFISLTDVEVRRQNGKVILESKFLNVRKDLIEIIMPEDLAKKQNHDEPGTKD